MAQRRGPGRALEDEDIGPELHRVKIKYIDTVFDPMYSSKKGKDGDAAFLDIGTPLYGVKGYNSAFRLAARRNDEFTIYEADTSPNASMGRHLLDIGDDKVRYIGVNSDFDGLTELAAIEDPGLVAALVEMVLDAPVDQSSRDPKTPHSSYFIAFHLIDGTDVIRGYWPDSGELSRGIMLPGEFRSAIEEALK